MAPIYRKYKIPKEYINTQKMTNAPNLNIQSEPSAPNKIMMEEKMRTGVCICFWRNGS